MLSSPPLTFPFTWVNFQFVPPALFLTPLCFILLGHISPMHRTMLEDPGASAKIVRGSPSYWGLSSPCMVRIGSQGGRCMQVIVLEKACTLVLISGQQELRTTKQRLQDFAVHQNERDWVQQPCSAFCRPSNITHSASLLISVVWAWPYFSFLALSRLLVIWSWPLPPPLAVSSLCCCPSKYPSISIFISGYHRQTLQTVGKWNVSLGKKKSL